ncbi:MAG: hemerythrin domain-containing protein, partial [Betaproteobacteria bacterium]|nr:hemerythrin domain-containing protein [Betaproteobacteria bacterium]
LLNPQAAKDKSAYIHAALDRLARKISMHLQVEDIVLYNLMQADPKVKATADRFQREMVDIKTALTGYLGKYATPEAIAANTAGFIADTQGILKALGDRIRREESELYPMFDTL